MLSRLKLERLKRGLTLLQVSALSGVNMAHVSLIERGLKRPSMHERLRLAELFQKPAERLFGKEKNI